jgi:hypothetical protein
MGLTALLSGLEKQLIRVSLTALILLVLLPTKAASGVVKKTRILSGVIYFTNNTPRNKSSFPVELFTADQKKRVAAADSYDGHSFVFKALPPGRYLLKITWPGSCVLWYRVDLRAGSKTGVRVIMDLDCAHANGAIRDLPGS